VEAYIKTPQQGGPIHSLAGFQRVRLMPGESRDITLTLDPRSISSVDDNGNRAVLAGRYHLSVGSAQPSETQQKSEADFTVQGTAPLPK
jgi:beta-glucosidase